MIRTKKDIADRLILNVVLVGPKAESGRHIYAQRRSESGRTDLVVRGPHSAGISIGGDGVDGRYVSTMVGFSRTEY